MGRPIVFAIVNRKGGVAKSTVAGHLAVRAAADGSIVSIIDTDEQGSLSAWWNAREAPHPAYVNLPELEALPGVIETVGQAGGQYLFIDTPPQVTEPIAYVVQQADFVVIPISPSPHDLRAVGRTLDIVRASGKPFIFVITRAKQNALLTVQTMGALSVHGVVSPAVLHDRVDFAASMTGGLTVLETDPKGRSAAEVAELWEFLKERLTAARDEKPTHAKGVAA